MANYRPIELLFHIGNNNTVSTVNKPKYLANLSLLLMY